LNAVAQSFNLDERVEVAVAREVNGQRGNCGLLVSDIRLIVADNWLHPRSPQLRMMWAHNPWSF
jgi:hypothetical protein